jgi:hypothetical protein
MMNKTQEKTPEIRESVRKELGRSFLLGGGVGGRKVESEIFERKVTLKLFALNTKTGKADLFIIYLFIYFGVLIFWVFGFLVIMKKLLGFTCCLNIHLNSFSKVLIFKRKLFSDK